MANLPPRFNWGFNTAQSDPALFKQLNQVYTDIAQVVNTRVSAFATTLDPTSPAAVNAQFKIGDIWVRTDTNQAWVMTSRTSDIAVTWTRFSAA
jgi:hypothetical protein